MGFVAQAGHFGLKTQTAKGTFLSPGAVAPNQGVFIFFRSGALGGNRELLIPDPEIGGARDIPDAAAWSDLVLGRDRHVRPHGVAGVLPAGRARRRTPSPARRPPASRTPSLRPTRSRGSRVEEKIGNGYEVFKYTDAKVNTFHMEADANGYLMATAGMIALKQELTTATAHGTQRRDSSPLIVGLERLRPLERRRPSGEVLLHRHQQQPGRRRLPSVLDVAG